MSSPSSLHPHCTRPAAYHCLRICPVVSVSVQRSLLTREPRAANVIAVTELSLAMMDRSAFERLLGSVKDIMHRQISEYRKAEDIETPSSASSS